MQKISIRTMDPRTMGKSVRRVASLASTIVQDTAANTASALRNLSAMTDVVMDPPQRSTAGTTRSVPCCPPDEQCPPACLLTISRTAHPGEIIMVPFRIHNASGETRKFRVGLRDMVDQHQNPAPSQPTLSRTEVTLPPMQSVLMTMRVDLTAPAYDAGDELQTTIVIRERAFNQNICVEILLTPYSNVPEAVPWDEKDLSTHFLSWHHHFYCDDPRVKPRVPKGKLKATGVDPSDV